MLMEANSWWVASVVWYISTALSMSSELMPNSCSIFEPTMACAVMVTVFMS